MAEYGILHQEPRYKVDDFAAEVLGRREATIQKMHGELKLLATSLIRAITSIKADKPWMELDRVHVDQIQWAPDGTLVLMMDLPGILVLAGKEHGDAEPMYHVDEFVAELMMHDHAAEPLTYEIAQMIAALVDQFSALAKHKPAFALEDVAFENVRWLEGSRLALDMTYRGRALTPETARWS